MLNLVVFVFSMAKGKTSYIQNAEQLSCDCLIEQAGSEGT